MEKPQTGDGGPSDKESARAGAALRHESIDRFDPDIAILDGIAVVLEQEGAILARLVAGTAGRGADLGVVDRLDPVLDHGDPGLLDDLPWSTWARWKVTS